MGTSRADISLAVSGYATDRAGRQTLAARLRPHTLALAALLAVALLYIPGLAPLPPQAFTYHDEGAKYLQVRNLRITAQGLDWSINYPARRYDPDLQFVPFHPKQHYIDAQGRIYLQWPIFLGLLTRVFWKTLGFHGLYVVPMLAGLGTLWAAYLLALAVGATRRMAWLAVPLLGLATPVALYSMLYFEHTVAALLVTLSVLAAVLGLRARERPLRGMAASGALLAVAVYFRSELYVLAVVLFFALAVWSWRKSGPLWMPLAWLGAFALALVPLWAFYAITEGNLLPTHALWYFAGSTPSGSASSGVPQPGLPPLRYIANAGWGVIPAFLFGPSTAPLAPRFPGWIEWAGLAGTLLCVLAALGKFRPTGKYANLPILALATGLALLIVSTGVTLLSPQPYYNLHGFLLASPFIALALWPSPGGGAGRFLYAVGLLYTGLHALIISALSGLGPISQHEWGQRYILPAYPLLVVLALLAFQGLTGEQQGTRPRSSPWSRRAVVALGVVLAFVGVGFVARGYNVLADEKAQVVSWLRLVRTLPTDEPVVTDTWWLPLNLAADFYTRPFMMAQDDGTLALWAEAMSARGVTRFGFVTANPDVLTGAWTRTMPGLRPDGVAQQVRGVWLQSYTLAGER